jgi:hypothetical protein
MEKSKNQMLNSDWESLIDKWKKLHSEGSFELATQFYYDELFDIVVERFKDNFSLSRDQETLISLLGFSPEPIILTAKALNPKNHYIITTKNIDNFEKINEYLDFKQIIKNVEENDFSRIYNTLNEIVVDHPTRNITIDITGGKKSMVSTASIFARDFGSQLVYVDFDVYLKNFRKPLPGTEKLVFSYRPQFLE